jgi:putative acetyltransferase
VAELVIAAEDPNAPDVQALLEQHLRFAARHSPPKDVHALDVSGLTGSNVTFFGVREDGRLVGVGALRRLDGEHAELKSMHTAEAARGRGVGRAMVDHLVGVARDGGFRRVSLETGSTSPFAPARALYRGAGFRYCAPFGEYGPSPHSVFMTLELDQPVRPAAGEPAGRRPATAPRRR